MAVKALLHYALEVPDQGAGEKFYSNFGLIDAPGRDGAVRLRPAPLQRESVLLYGGPRKRLHHLAFGAPGDEYAATREAVRRAGIREVDPPRGGSTSDRKSTRLNSSHTVISYAVFCLKKKKRVGRTRGTPTN